MPDTAVILPGFFGKLPAMGDFVRRGLPGPFVSRWDRWISRHLVRRLAGVEPGERFALRFLLGIDAFGPMAGVIIASTDRSGRFFPLTIAAQPPRIGLDLFSRASDWFRAVAAAGMLARDSNLPADDLSEALGRLPLPDLAEPDEPFRSMALSRMDRPPLVMDMATPEDALDRIFLETAGSG